MFDVKALSLISNKLPDLMVSYVGKCHMVVHSTKWDQKVNELYQAEV